MKPILLALLLSPVASAATFSPTRFDDPAPDGCQTNGCSLREAAAAAAALPGSDTVSLIAGEYVLDAQRNGLVTIAVPNALVLVGPNMNTTTVRSRGRGPMFKATNTTFTVRGLTMRDGDATSATVDNEYTGGAIRVRDSKLFVDKAAFRDNHAAMGGAIFAEGASPVELNYAAFTGNNAEFNGGAVWIGGATSSLALNRTLMEANSAMDGGAIMAWDNSKIRVRGSSTLRGNLASRWGGAAHFAGEFAADDDTVVTGNTAEHGGAFSTFGWYAALRGVATANGSGLLRIEGNSASYGGGLRIGDYAATVDHVQLIGNDAVHFGGGLYVYSQTLAMRDSHIADNVSHTGGGVQIQEGNGDFERVSIQDNHATDSGGGMSLGYGTHSLRNVDVYRNTAGYAPGIRNYGTLSLSHVTVWNNGPLGAREALWLWPTSTTSYANSLLLGRCAGGGVPSAQGKNLRSNETANACPGSLASNTFLSRATFAGPFEITGTANPASTLIDSGSAAHCMSTDIRNRIRDAKCDVGAFEFGAR
jgi:hypothetical protein